MEKRMINFLLAATLFMMVYSSLQMFFNPPPPPELAEVLEGDAAGEPDGTAGENASAAVENSGASDTETGANSDSDAVPSGSESTDDNSLTQPDEPQDVGLQRVVLGSLDPASPYQMAVYFSNKGAVIERIELNSPRYRELNAKSGFLGSLTLQEDDKGGCRVETVAAGSPAALATTSDGLVGLQGPVFEAGKVSQPGDRIIKINGADVVDVVSVNAALASTVPGDSTEIAVIRGANGATKELVFTATLGEQPLSLISPEARYLGGDYGDKGEANTALHDHQLSFLWTLGKVGTSGVRAGKDEIDGLTSMWHENWRVNLLPDDGAGQGVEFARSLTAEELKQVGGNTSLEFVKQYRLTSVNREEGDKLGAPGYGLKLKLKIRNTGNQSETIAHQLDGPTGMPLEGWWYSYKVHPSAWSGAGARDVIIKGGEDNLKHELIVCSAITKSAKKDKKDEPFQVDPETNELDLEYVGCDTQYFSVVLKPDYGDVEDEQVTAEQKEKYVFAGGVARSIGVLDEERKKQTDVSFRMVSRSLTLKPGETYEQDFVIFAGPKQPEVLAEYGLSDCIVYGWWIVKAVAQPMSGILHTIRRVVPSWGLSIIMLTVLVRGLMLPLGRKMAQNAAKMQELAPEMKLITEKYKNDMEKRAQAQRELFAKHKYNPMAGCPLMLIQFPVFVGLYRSLSVDIELRQAPFFPGMSWCSNLAGPDQFLYWENFVPAMLSAPAGWLGPYLNVLPLITCGLFILQQKLFTPPPQDEQQEMQQQIMKFMMIFMGVMFHKVAAGLCIYLIASSIWGICEKTFLPKDKPKSASGGAGVSTETEPAMAGAMSGAAHGKNKKKKKKKRKR